MSSPRLSIFVALLGVLLALHPPLAKDRIKNSISNFPAARASWQKFPDSKPASGDQDLVGYKLSPEQYARAVAYAKGSIGAIS
jgi:hypothetical protein